MKYNSDFTRIITNYFKVFALIRHTFFFYLIVKFKRLKNTTNKNFKPQLVQHSQPYDFSARTILLENLHQVQLSRKIQFTYNTIIFITYLAFGQRALAHVTRAVKSRAHRSVPFCSESASVGKRIFGSGVYNNAGSRTSLKTAQSSMNMKKCCRSYCHYNEIYYYSLCQFDNNII
jgi:hypothetical protein